MNEQIKQLAEKSGWRYVLGGNPQTLIEDRDYLVTNEQAEKFAILVIQEYEKDLRESRREVKSELGYSRIGLGNV